MLNRMCKTIFSIAFYTVRCILNVSKNSTKYILYKVFGIKKHESKRYENDYLNGLYKLELKDTENDFIIL